MAEEAGGPICPGSYNLMTPTPPREVAQWEGAHDVDALAAHMQTASIGASPYSRKTYVAEQPTAVGEPYMQAPTNAWPLSANTSRQFASESDPCFSSGPSALWGYGYAGGSQDTTLGEEDDYDGQPAVSSVTYWNTNIC